MVYCNDFESYKSARNTSAGNLKRFYGDNITDRGKFFFCKELQGTDHTYFTFDDDLLYPPNYVEHTLKQMEKHPGAVVSYHGKRFNSVDKYYRPLSEAEQREDFRCLGDVETDQRVNILGTGCMAFRLRDFCPTDLREDMMADLEVSNAAKHLPLIVLAHQRWWINYNPKMKGKWTIWDEFQTRSDDRQVEYLRKIITV
jgi:hypothetical protein